MKRKKMKEKVKEKEREKKGNKGIEQHGPSFGRVLHSLQNIYTYAPSLDPAHI